MKIYVLVTVSYDYYRFQVNEYAHVDKQKVLDHAKSLNNTCPIFEYEEASKEADKLDDDERPHFWIETFECDYRL